MNEMPILQLAQRTLMQLTFNSDALHEAAVAAGDIGPSGKLNYSSIGRRARIDTAVVSRVHRGVNAPDLRTIIGMARAYGLAVEDLLSVSTDDMAAAA